MWVVCAYRYSVTHHNQEGSESVLPGIYFYYDFSSILVSYKETQVTFLHFLTQVSAIVGGIFTVSMLLDRIIYSAYSKNSQQPSLD